MADRLSNDEFFAKLTTLISNTQAKGHGSVYLTQKRLTYESSNPATAKVSSDSLQDLNPERPLPLLVRATDGKSQSKDRTKNREKVKLSTVVQPDDIETFFGRYAEVCKTGMQSLKKRDRSKRKKTKKKAVEEKK
ncbi:signal recognition particle, SRP9/SRP14 subunit [Dissoconium aciculare CBS 342.82]|uniref:Signal recognition particle subunit SRP14 n=1 Tax=Dissoconium aciculare CBS 342.82 TaxID=1314786 RepID=A0A6J3LTH9_9PEZI|nr:signal recognition particle, SRP9/SRP14 subunit [Dissoconium aciculare CBS 342.82]KAF1817932.1 signal recognition particle, SRP9/SRP14 subunit [Dissoconium aciculare CBS 342.82]